MYFLWIYRFKSCHIRGPPVHKDNVDYVVADVTFSLHLEISIKRKTSSSIWAKGGMTLKPMFDFQPNGL